VALNTIDIPKFSGDACDHCGTDTARHGLVDAHVSSSPRHSKLRHQLCEACGEALVKYMESRQRAAMGVRSKPRPDVVDAEFREEVNERTPWNGEISRVGSLAPRRK
jgi:hypothetical protein